jgi:flagellar basal body-associated protein FliL
MPRSAQNRRGLTVLALLLLIIALAVAGYFVLRYLGSRPAATSSSTTGVIPAAVS